MVTIVLLSVIYMCFSYFRKTVLNGGTQVPQPYSLSVFENHIFFTDWTKMAVVQANRFNGSSPKLLYRTTDRPGHIVVSHAVLQPIGEKSLHDIVSCGE